MGTKPQVRNWPRSNAGCGVCIALSMQSCSPHSWRSRNSGLA